MYCACWQNLEAPACAETFDVGQIEPFCSGNLDV